MTIKEGVVEHARRGYNGKMGKGHRAMVILIGYCFRPTKRLERNQQRRLQALACFSPFRQKGCQFRHKTKPVWRRLSTSRAALWNNNSQLFHVTCSSRTRFSTESRKVSRLTSSNCGGFPQQTELRFGLYFLQHLANCSLQKPSLWTYHPIWLYQQLCYD
jgi:hypothetical protein